MKLFRPDTLPTSPFNENDLVQNYVRVYFNV